MRLTRNCTSNSLMSLSVVSLAWPGSGLKGLIRFLPNPLHAYPLLGFPPFLLCTYAMDSYSHLHKNVLSPSLPTHSNKILLWLVITFLFLLIRPLREGVLLRWSARAREKSSPLPKLLLLCFFFLVPVFFYFIHFMFRWCLCLCLDKLGVDHSTPSHIHIWLLSFVFT